MTRTVVAQKRRLNSAIRDSFPHASHPVAFVCECGATDCSTTVWLPTHAYDSRRRDPAWAVLAPGHFAMLLEDAA